MWVYVFRDNNEKLLNDKTFLDSWAHKTLAYLLDLTHKLGGQMQKLRTNKKPTHNNKTIEHKVFIKVSD